MFQAHRNSAWTLLTNKITYNMKFYELTDRQGNSRGLFATKRERERAYIDNFLSGGPELIEKDSEVETDERGWVSLHAGYLRFSERAPQGLYYKWKEMKIVRLTPFFRTPEEAHEALKPFIPKGCTQKGFAHPFWYEKRAETTWQEYCTQTHGFNE